MKRILVLLFISSVAMGQIKRPTSGGSAMTHGAIVEALNTDSLVLTKPFSVGNGGVYLVNTWMDTMHVSHSVAAYTSYYQASVVTGAAIGDKVSVIATAAEIDDIGVINPYGIVVAPNEVRVMFNNYTENNGTINNRTFNILVQRFVKP